MKVPPDGYEAIPGDLLCDGCIIKLELLAPVQIDLR